MADVKRDARIRSVFIVGSSTHHTIAAVGTSDPVLGGNVQLLSFGTRCAAAAAAVASTKSKVLVGFLLLTNSFPLNPDALFRFCRATDRRWQR